MQLPEPVSARLHFVRLPPAEQVRQRSGALGACLQRLVRYWAGDFGHVSPVMVFEDGGAMELAFYTNEPTGKLRPWHYNPMIPSATVCLEVLLQADECERFWRAMKEMEGRPYSLRAFCFNFIPLLRDCLGTDSDRALICSQAAVLALQRARPGTFDALVPARTSPGQLYRFVVESGMTRELG
jgi:hypothetical protein